MKRLIFGFCILLYFGAFSQGKVNVKLSQKQSYCGGARPSEEILERYKKPLPYVNKKLIIVSSNGKIDSTTTDTKGALKLKLKPGSYKLYEAWRYRKRTPDGTTINDFDTSCLAQVWQKPDITIDVQKRKQVLTIDLDPVYCPHTIPCLNNPHIPE
jgi:hypothetical protein